MDLEDMLQQTASSARLNAIDAAYLGSPYGGTNFQAKWKGYNDDGLARVEYEDRIYTASNIGSKSIQRNKKVILRVAKGRRQVNY